MNGRFARVSVPLLHRTTQVFRLKIDSTSLQTVPPSLTKLHHSLGTGDQHTFPVSMCYKPLAPNLSVSEHINT